MKEKLRKNIMAGIAISIGGMAFLSADNKIVGSLLFSIGLLMVCNRRYRLFTGYIPYIKSVKQVQDVCSICAINILTALWCGLFFGAARPDIQAKAIELCDRKFSETWLQTILLGMLCNALIYIAVDAYKRLDGYKSETVLIVVLCVMVFILTGAEHCVANAFYIGAANARLTVALPFLGLNIIGNAAGGILFRQLEGYTVWA